MILERAVRIVTRAHVPRLGEIKVRNGMVDNVLEDSFPASDPPSWNPGTARPAPAAHQAHERLPDQTGAGHPGITDRPTSGTRAFMHAVISLAGAAGIALLVPFAILLVGVPVALLVRGLTEAIGWLFNFMSL
jgi:hypothetical protein